MSEGRLNAVTVTVGQKKATNYSKESFDANESVTLEETTALEVGLLRKVLRIKLMGSIVFDMIAFDSMVSESLNGEDVTEMVRVSEHQLRSLATQISGLGDEESPNKEILVSHIMVANQIIEDIKEQLG